MGKLKNKKVISWQKVSRRWRGVDFHDTFALVTKLGVVETKRDLIINQLDVNNTFLHGD